MNKSSTSYLFGCYIWLVNTIARGPISRAAIDDRWARASVNDYKTDSIPECTFHRWRNNIQLLFDVTIKCNTYGEYYIEDGSSLHDDDWRNRMLNLFAVNSLLKDCKELRSQILYEPVPSGEKFLSTVVEAMRDHCLLKMTYQSFTKRTRRASRKRSSIRWIASRHWSLLMSIFRCRKTLTRSIISATLTELAAWRTSRRLWR